MGITGKLAFAIAFALSVLTPVSSHAEEFPDEEPPTPTLFDLARKTQNPISDLLSALAENRFNFGVGPSNGLQYTFNLEEFYPLRLTDKVNLVQRPIIPVVTQPSLAPGQSGQGGLGDISYQAYVCSANQSGLIFGFGPILTIPTAYPHELGAGRWSGGPTAALLTVAGSWVGGFLTSQYWSFTTYNDRPAVSLLQIQPFINYNFSNGWYVTSSPLLKANWHATSGNTWTVPVGGGFGKVFKIGEEFFNAQLQGFGNVITPDSESNWSTVLQFQMLFPKKKESRGIGIPSSDI